MKDDWSDFEEENKNNNKLYKVPNPIPEGWLEEQYKNRTFIPMKELEDGCFYKGICRNATVAKWNEEEQKFIYLRSKFGSKFLEDIKPIELDDGFDLFIPHEKTKINKELQEYVEIKLKECKE